MRQDVERGGDVLKDWLMQWEKQRSFDANKQLFGLGRTTLEPCRAVWDRAGKEFFYHTQGTADLGCVEPFSLIFYQTCLA